MAQEMRGRPALPVLIAIALPLLLAVAVAAIAINARIRGLDEPAPAATAPAETGPAETGPVAVVPVDAPDAGGPDCAALLASLPANLTGADGPLPSRPLADPVQPGVRAWAAAPRPVVLRCGLPRPAELTPTSALLQVNGVAWLELDDGVPDSDVVTHVAVDRPAYVVLTTPVDAGGGPLQQVSDVIRETLPATDVIVR